MAKGGKSNVLIVKGMNFLGRNLTRVLLDQGGTVGLLDEYGKGAREFVKHFKDEAFKFYDVSLVEELAQKVQHVDYVILLLHKLPPENLKTNEYLSLVTLINQTLEFAEEKHAKVVLVTSMHWQKGDDETETGHSPTEVPQFAEKSLMDYVKSSNLNGRIVRLGELYGHGMDLTGNTPLVDTITQALSKEEIAIPGEGLQFRYYVHVLDAVYGVLKSLFSDRARGNTYTLANPQEISLLTLAHKVLENTVVAKRVNFMKLGPAADEEPLFDKTFELQPNLSEIGWKPKISFERGLAQTVDYFREARGLPSKATAKDAKQNIGKQKKPPKDDGLTLSVKMDDVLPIEMGKEKARFEKLQKLKKVKSSKVSKDRAKNIFRYVLYALLTTGLLALYFFVIVPVIGIGKAVVQSRNGLESYLAHLNASEMEMLSEDMDYVDQQVDELEIYLGRMSWLFNVTNTENGADRIVANVYGVQSMMRGIDHVLEVENGVDVVISSAEPEITNMRQRQALIQAQIELGDASGWFVKGARVPASTDFWAPYDSAQTKVSELIIVIAR